MRLAFYIIFIQLFIIFSACNTEKALNNCVTSESNGLSLNLSPNALKPVKSDTVLAYSLGNYKEYLVPTDYTIALRSIQKNPLSKQKIFAYTKNNSELSLNTKSPDALPCVYINQIPLYNEALTKSGDTKKTNLREIFGTKALFRTSKTYTKSNDDAHELYVPQIIKLTSPEINGDEDLYPLCDYSNFVLKWNADSNNENGVLVIIEWDGTMILGEHYPDTYVRRVDCFPDLGELTINPHMFDDIPDTALCKLYIGRGSVDNFLSDNYSYKILSETHESLDFILIRNLK